MRTRFALFAFLLGMTQIAALPLFVAPARAESVQGAETNQDVEEMHWREHASNLRAEQAAAEKRFEEAQQAYHRAQNRRNFIMGGKRQAVIDDYNAAKDALAKANKALEDLPEEARRAGAFPGWIRE